ncbi:hypothetical protein AJ79_07573 [Helicocarpus griseus UAMH5409]|uniref:Store-operated calcium entry-associated regulatory factor n=1 Tax=Helicocarpus griseus UAMH5409 TaxID=1447875 RepID=A0A2B7WTJ5_9EURO|nr:hypothetical protein AJ79_07573 [Helicocarpus griseus UAMH5409]
MISAYLCLISLSLLISPLTYAAKYTKPPSSPSAVHPSSIPALTLYSNRQTTSRRLAPIPQLTCIGPSKKICALYTPDVMRCTNQGHDYDPDDIQWTCTAQLPPEFKLGSTEVVCEGYRGAEDPWVLKGSCGVEYRLLLTEKGEERYGKLAGSWGGGSGSTWGSKLRAGRRWLESLGDAVFFLFFFGVLAVIVLAALGCFEGNGRGRGGRRLGGGGWGGWGPGGGGGGGWDDPPPPYDYPGYRKSEPWRPGFWTGAAAGSAAGYAMGWRSGSGSGFGSGLGSGWGSNRAESSRAASSRSSFSGPTSTSESTGFGSTRRR